MEQYGEFSASVSRLESNLVEVRGVWSDQTAQTYDQINENMEALAEGIWAHYFQSVSEYDLVRANYNEAEIDSELNILSAKIDSV